MIARGPLFDYLVSAWARDARGHFTTLETSETLTQCRRKLAEWHARQRSQQSPDALVTLVRGGVILVHLLNGRVVAPEAIVADAARAAASSTEQV